MRPKKEAILIQNYILFFKIKNKRLHYLKK